jgi:hypothetical protein
MLTWCATNRVSQHFVCLVSTNSAIRCLAATMRSSKALIVCLYGIAMLNETLTRVDGRSLG